MAGNRTAQGSHGSREAGRPSSWLWLLREDSGREQRVEVGAAGSGGEGAKLEARGWRFF